VVGRVLNAGTGREISIGDLMQKIGGLMGVAVSAHEEAERLRPQQSEVGRLVSDASALRECTGWSPGVDLESGLQRTISWFTDSANLDHYKTTAFHL